MTHTLPASSRVHLVGIGGSGMSALAQILLERGYPVSGSDLRGGRTCAVLEAMGAVVHLGHDAAHVDGAGTVAVSTAIPASNPEVVRATELGMPVLRRAELLAALMTGYRQVLVAGTHGKTTTTSMLTVGLQAAGLDPSFAIGGALHEAGTSAHHGSGDLFVAEADESDRSFLVYSPDCAVVTNVELDHPDHFASLDEVHAAFAGFLECRTPDAPAIVCADDVGSLRLGEQAAGPVLTYGTADGTDLRISDRERSSAGTRFRLHDRGEDLGWFEVAVLGTHNVLNATAAVAAGLWAGAHLDSLRAGLARFGGAQRRFQRLGEAAGVTVIDDYAHHPTELVATLDAARQARFPGKVVAVFQPHRYSRTAMLGAELGRALAGADTVIVTDVYGAGEDPVPGVTGGLVADAARTQNGEVHLAHSPGELLDLLSDLAEPGDVVLTLGAGDITELGPVLLARLDGRDA
jgi:UDP-N-acetylmuramate--alanine ligase